MNKEQILAELGKNLKAARINASKTQEQLAESLDFDRAHISRLESGKRNPSFFTICKIAEYLQVDLKSLIKNIKL